MNLQSTIEAILFFKGEPISHASLARTLERDEQEVIEAVNVLEEQLQGRGLTLIRKDEGVMLGTAPEAAPVIEQITKEELSKDIGKAGLETLSVVLYRGPLPKSEIDYIRGVNSSSILRNLLVRGLIAKKAHPEGKKVTLYEASYDLLAHLGLSRVSELPEYTEANEEIDAFKNEQEQHA